MATLGEAFIEVHADTRPFARELNAEIKAILKKIDATISVEGQKIGGSLGDGIGRGLKDKADPITGSFWQQLKGRLGRIGTEAGKEFSDSFQRLATSNFILFRVIGNIAQRMGALFTTVRRVGGEVFSFGKALLQANKAMLQLGFQGIKSLLGFTNNLAGSLQSAQQAGAQLAGALGSLAASAASGAFGLAAMAAAVVLLTTVLAALAAVVIVAAAPFATLLNLALLLPGALSVVLGIIAPLVIALHGLGDVMDLVFEKDPKKFAEGFKELPPVMQQLTTSLRRLLPLFNDIQNTVQRKFLGPIISILEPTLKRIGPSLTRGLGMAAQAMGIFVAQAINLLNTPAFTRFIAELFPSIARMIDTLGPPLLSLMTSLAIVATASLPTIELLITKLGGFIETFAKWLADSVADGSFQRFLDTALASLQSIWDLVVALILLFAEMFTETDDGGRRFLDKITKAINEFTKWLKSPDGKRALQDAVLLALAFAEAFRIALGVIRIIVTELSRGVRMALALLDLIGIIDNKDTKKTLSNRQPANSFSGGGVVGYDQIAMVHKGEPILDPANSADKNRSILADAGMLDLLAQPQTIIVNVGGTRFAEYIDYRIQTAQRSQATSVKYGARTS
jgi:hypothetical protein